MSGKFSDSASSLKSDGLTVVGSGWLGTSFILANIILGVGLLNFPAAYSDAGGLPTALAAQFVCVLFIGLSLYLIVECADMADVGSYQDTVHRFCGDAALVICNILIFLHNFGTCVTFMVILADQLDQVMLFAYGEGYCEYWYMSRQFTLSIAALFMLPLSLYSRIDSFKFISVIGVISTLYITFLAAWKFATYDRTETVITWQPRDWMDVFRVFPVICFSFEGHIEAVPLYACLRNRTHPEFVKVIICALAMCATIYTLVGSLVYLTVGDAVPSDLLNAYSPVDIPVIVGTAIMGVKAIVTYPEIMFCSRMVLDETMERFYSRCAISGDVARVVESIVLFALALALAQLVPTIGSVIAVLGGSAAVFVFVFPGLCVLHANKYGKCWASWMKVVLGVFMMALGMFLAGTSTTQAIMNIAATGPTSSQRTC